MCWQRRPQRRPRLGGGARGWQPQDQEDLASHPEARLQGLQPGVESAETWAGDRAHGLGGGSRAAGSQSRF